MVDFGCQETDLFLYFKCSHRKKGNVTVPGCHWTNPPKNALTALFWSEVHPTCVREIPRVFFAKTLGISHLIQIIICKSHHRLKIRLSYGTFFKQGQSPSHDLFPISFFYFVLKWTFFPLIPQLTNNNCIHFCVALLCGKNWNNTIWCAARGSARPCAMPKWHIKLTRTAPTDTRIHVQGLLRATLCWLTGSLRWGQAIAYAASGTRFGSCTQLPRAGTEPTGWLGPWPFLFAAFVHWQVDLTCKRGSVGQKRDC